MHFSGPQAIDTEVQALATSLGQGLVVSERQLVPASWQGRVVNKTFDKLSIDLLQLIAQFVCDNIKDYCSFSTVCKRFKSVRALVFCRNPRLIEDFCSKRGQSDFGNILDAIPKPTLGFIKAQSHTIESFTYPTRKGKSEEHVYIHNVEALVIAFPNIKKLDLSSCNLRTEDCLTPLSRIHLRELHLGGERRVAYPQLKCISKISALQKLTLPKLSEDADTITSLQNLQSLRLLTCPENNENLQYLQQLPNLQEIDFKVLRFCIGDKDLVHIAKVANLTALNLYRCVNITDAGLIHVSNATRLQKLNLGLTRVTGKGISAIGNLCFTHLNLNHCGVSDLRALRHIESLEELSLAGTAITDEGLEPLVRAKNLTKLNLEGCHKMDGSCLKHMTSSQHKLRELNLEGAGIKHLVLITTLTRLNLKYLVGTLKINDECLAAMCKHLCNLRVLHLTTITDTGLQCVSSLKKLLALNLSPCSKITYACRDQLQMQLPRLKFDVNSEKLELLLT